MGRTRAPADRWLAALFLAGLGGAPGALAQSAPPTIPQADTSLAEPRRFSSDEFTLRGTSEADVADPDAPLREPLDRQNLDPSVSSDRRLGAPPAPGDDADAAAPPAFDLFSGPSAPRRQNLPEPSADERNAQAQPAGSLAPRARPRIPSRAAARALEDGNVLPGEERSDALLLRRFDPVGPVRSPVLDDVASTRRLNGGLDGLRTALPRRADDPFAPVGVRVGSFILYPAIEETLGASTNLTNTLDGRRGALSQTTLSGRLVSDWSRHAAEINAQLAYRHNFAGPVKDEPELDVDGRLRLDVDHLTTATLRGALSLRQDDSILTGTPDVARNRSDVLAYSLGADVTRAFGRASGTATVEAVREDREDGVFRATGFEPGQSFATVTGALRGSYDMGSAFKPFLLASLGKRLFDDDTALGTSRDALIPALRAGFGFDFGEKLSGEVGLGYAWNVPDDEALRTDGSPTVDALLAWSPRRGTDLSLRATTVFEPDAGGLDTATLYQTTVGLRHRATARLDLEGAGQLAWRVREASGTERIRSGELGLTWWLNRQLALIARYRHDRFEGVLTDYDADTVRVGLRVQR
ncbi:outer membrane beta-barrel protein [Aureimonas sp. AU4]|uniref:outer membrane beta-barrel protein n=1 Tax=Aureimonas sp. AU4 TaxID=1638163 RepID=UPI0007865042|nr:outer membrane beta-barrel protein [Aureimonas sp. AU4]